MSRTNPLLRRQARHTDPAQLERGRENFAALRAQHEYDHQQATWKAQEMAKREKSPMNFNRVDTSAAEEGLIAYGELNARLDDALDEIDQAMKRGRLAQASGTSDDDLRRSTALRNRRGA